MLILAVLAGFGLMAGWKADSATRSSNHAIAQTPQWQPNQPSSDIRYIGAQACAQCHQSKVSDQANTAMAHALFPSSDCQLLQSRPRLSFRNGSYLYEIKREGGRSLYIISDGKNTITEPILWCFGKGVLGQTYVIRRQGQYYETRVSFYTGIDGLDFTPGAPRGVPESLDAAVGQLLNERDTTACFTCHSTVAPGAARIQPDRLTPGIACEACHGPGEKHLALMKSVSTQGVSPKEKGIFNPGRMNPDEMSQQFCGACHRSWETVMQMPERGGSHNLRFQPYRLANSKCYQNPDDRRLSCTACHNPHEELKHDATFYDTKCAACHKTGEKSATGKNLPICPVGKKDCASCHMLKIEPPGLHFKLTDHHIRIVRPNEPIPR
jgi:hypothetical protein